MWGVLDYLCAGTRRAWRARKVHRAFAFGEGRADGALSRGSWGWAAELAGPMALKFDVGFSEDENLKWRKSMEVRVCVFAALSRCETAGGVPIAAPPPCPARPSGCFMDTTGWHSVPRMGVRVCFRLRSGDGVGVVPHTGVKGILRAAPMRCVEYACVICCPPPGPC